jgi:hypothetical protein
MKRGPVDPAPLNLSRAERRIVEAVRDAGRGGISLGDLEIEAGVEGHQLKHALAAMENKGIIHSESHNNGSHYSHATFTKWYPGAATKARAA